jgi:hypothetical protein
MFKIKNKLYIDEPGISGDSLQNASSLDDIASLFVGEDNAIGPEQEEGAVNEENKEELVEKNVDEDKKNEESASDVTWGVALGVDDSQIALDENGNLVGLKSKVDGVEETVPVKDLIAGYRNNKYNTQKSQILAEEQRQLQEIRETAAKMYESKLEDVSKLMTYMKAQLVKDYQGINWEQVRNSNPGEYAALVQDFNLKTAEFDTLLQNLEHEKKASIAQQQQEFKKVQDAHKQAQLELTLKNNPEWNNPTVMKQAIGDLGNFVVDTYGFTQQDFMSINDARIVEVLKDAMKFRSGVKEAEKKIVQSAPKFQRQTNARQSNVSHLDKLIKKAENTTGVAKKRAQTDAIAQLLLNENIKV